jgi:hypothetical protein
MDIGRRNGGGSLWILGSYFTTWRSVDEHPVGNSRRRSGIGGPGMYSIDARLFGWRRIDVPDRMG